MLESGTEPPAKPLPAGGGRLICFVSANPDAPSFRYRLAPLIPLLQAQGWHCEVVVLNERWPGWRIWQLRAVLKRSAAVVLHKLRLAPWEARWVRALQPASLFDVDDAIWLRQPKWVGHQRPASPGRAAKFAGMCLNAALTTVGNQVLAAKATAAGGRVLVVPTAINAQTYPERLEGQLPGLVVVWVGLPGNLQYLEPLRPVFARLMQCFPGMSLRVISSAWPDWPEVQVEQVRWSAETEQAQLCSADIGIMPLSDDEFSRGKCAFKLLQYMAAGLPCVASPVGANCEVVQTGRTGILASTPEAWEAALSALLQDAELRLRMGREGRHRALSDYDASVILPNMALRLAQLADAGVDAGVEEGRGA